MRRLYEKKEILFAVLWIVAYCVILGTIRGNFGDESICMLITLLVFTAGIIVFVKTNHLEGKYGLAGWPKDMKKYLFFIPMWILATGNIWDGFAPSYQGTSLVIAAFSMILVGFVEEMIFRGFLFKAMMEGDKTIVAIIVSAVTFGVGHIVNLFTGGSIIPCIIAHSLIDVLSLFGADNELIDWIYIGATIVVAIAYCLYLSRIHSPESKGGVLTRTDA